MADELMGDLARYRQFHGLPAIPSPHESTPLVMSVAGRTNRFLTPTAIYLVVKEVFRCAAAALETTDPVGAATLRRASTHWLRHTSATHQADAGNDIRFIKKTCDRLPLRPPRFISMRRMTSAKRRRKGPADDAYTAQPFSKQGQSRLSIARGKE